MKLSHLFFLVCFCFSTAFAQIVDAAKSPSPKGGDELVIIQHRPIVTFRATILGIEAQERKIRAEKRIADQLKVGGKHSVSMMPMPPGIVIKINDKGSFYIAPEDCDPFQQESLDSVAKNAIDNLQLAIKDIHESRSLDFMLEATGYALGATFVFFLLVWAIFRFQFVMEKRITAFAHSKIEHLGERNARIVNRERIQLILHRIFQSFSLVMVLMLAYKWLSICMSQFPYTRPFAEHLDSYFVGLMGKLAGAFLNAIPDLFTAFIIVLLARAATQGLSHLFEQIHHKHIELNWFDPDLAIPTRRIANMAIWLFALAMIYPYLPGANTEAFKGLSVLIGLMISIGASGLVGQVVSGLILTYTGIYRRGDFVRVLDHKGVITELGMFSTRIRNPSGIELTVSNALMLSNVTLNYSKIGRGEMIIETTVSIGYDTPWRQAHAMLMQAAERTSCVLKTPEPTVYQTRLADFYYEYTLACHILPDQMHVRAAIYDQLLSNILDIFNENGVTLMSPNYTDDPATEKLVPVSNWYQAPANSPNEKV